MKLILLPYILLALTFLSMWVRKDLKVWGTLLVLCVASALYTGALTFVSLPIILAWSALWYLFKNKRHYALFALIVLFSYGFKFHFFPGFNPLHVDTNFYLGLGSPLVGVFALALFVPLSLDVKGWFKGFWLTCVGIGTMAVIAVATNAVHLEYKLPTHPLLRYLSNLLLVCIAEEAFYRGFVQKELCQKLGKIAGVILTSLLFTLAHIYWTSSPAILAFAFIASLLYGSVYLLSGKIESAILCHFLLNFMHMTFFSYHAM